MEMPKKPSSPEMRAFLDSKLADEIVDYSNRGRVYRSFSEEDLIRLWKEAWDDLGSDSLNQQKWNAQADLAAEFSLRNLQVPWELVKTQYEAFCSAYDRSLKEFMKKNPEAVGRAEKKIEADLQEFRDARKRSN